jgi:hypothetical protein
MSASGYTPIITYNSSTTGHTPTTITTGELAVNITDGILFVGTGTNTYNTLVASKGTTSITTLGTVTTGTWNATAIAPAYGGTGVANGSNNTVTFTGNYTLGVTLTANTAITFPTSGTLGYQNIPQNSQSTAYTTVAGDAGYTIFHPASDSNARTFTIASNASVPYALGTVIQFINMSSSNVTIAINSDTLTWSTGGASGSRTLAQYGVANAIKIASTQWLITGSNLS